MCAWKFVRQNIVEMAISLCRFLFSLLTIPGRQVQSEEEWWEHTRDKVRCTSLASFPDECSSNHGLSDGRIKREIELEKIIISLEEGAQTLKDELMSMNCQLEFFRSQHQENNNMLRVVRNYLSYFRPHKEASSSALSFSHPEGDTDKELAYFREFFSYFVPPERLCNSHV